MASADGIVDVGFDETGKVLDKIDKISKFKQCYGKMELKNFGKVTGGEYLAWLVKHEESCLLNHEGSPQVKKVITGFIYLI